MVPRRGPPSPVRFAFWLLVPLATFTAACAGGPPRGSAPDPHDPAVRIHALLHENEKPVLAVHTGDTVHLGPEVRAFYQRRRYRPAWTDASGFLPRTEPLLRALSAAGEEGLEVENYHREAVHELVKRATRDDAEGLPVGDLLGSIDMLLSESFIRYTTDVVRGTVDPEAGGDAWRIPRGDPTDAPFLHALIERNDLGKALDELRPRAPEYRRLRGGLARYEAAARGGGWPPVGAGDALAEGAQGPRVLQLRARLAREGDPTEVALVAGAAEPGRYDAALARAVGHFQQRHGLEPDGTVGQETLGELNVPAGERLLSLHLNLDRWRWLPRELGRRYLMVNVPGFRLSVVENEEPVLEMGVVVGEEGWKTPIFHDTLEHIVVNPYWNVPTSIARQEIAPAVQRDPGYLARNRYEVVDRSGRRVVPSSVDLDSDRYTLRQRPGHGNALGTVKFLFPNAMNVYLHDTPAGHLFSRASRAFSHGCIRVEKPRELARYLLRTATSRSPDDFDSLVGSGREHWISLEEKIPVYVLYFTAWADRAGSVYFYRDVYRRDEALARVAREKLQPPPGGDTPDAPHGAA